MIDGMITLKLPFNSVLLNPEGKKYYPDLETEIPEIPKENYIFQGVKQKNPPAARCELHINLVL